MPRVHPTISKDVFHWRSATGSKWVKVRDATKLPTMYRTAPTTENYLMKNSAECSAEIEKPHPRSSTGPPCCGGLRKRGTGIGTCIIS